MQIGTVLFFADIKQANWMCKIFWIYRGTKHRNVAVSKFRDPLTVPAKKLRQYAYSSLFSTWDHIRGCKASSDRSISSQKSRRLSCVHSLDPWQRSLSASCNLLILETRLKCRHNIFRKWSWSSISYTWDTSCWRWCSHRFCSFLSILDLSLFHLTIQINMISIRCKKCLPLS